MYSTYPVSCTEYVLAQVLYSVGICTLQVLRSSCRKPWFCWNRVRQAGGVGRVGAARDRSRRPSRGSSKLTNLQPLASGGLDGECGWGCRQLFGLETGRWPVCLFAVCLFACGCSSSSFTSTLLPSSPSPLLLSSVPSSPTPNPHHLLVLRLPLSPSPPSTSSHLSPPSSRRGYLLPTPLPRTGVLP